MNLRKNFPLLASLLIGLLGVEKSEGEILMPLTDGAGSDVSPSGPGGLSELGTEDSNPRSDGDVEPVSEDTNPMPSGILAPKDSEDQLPESSPKPGGVAVSLDSDDQKPEGSDMSDAFDPRSGEDEAGFPVLILDKLGDANNDTQDNGIVPSKMEDRGDSKNPVAVAGDQIEASNMAGNPNMAAQSAANENLICYDIQCNGAGCVPEAIIQAGTGVTTCTATGNNVCRIEEIEHESGISIRARCGPRCDSADITGPVVTTEPSKEGTTWTEWPLAKGDITTDFNEWNFPKRRRKRSTAQFARLECCNESYCNHDNPCGSLTCAADAPVLAKYLTYVMIGFAFIYMQMHKN